MGAGQKSPTPSSLLEGPINKRKFKVSWKRSLITTNVLIILDLFLPAETQLKSCCTVEIFHRWRRRHFFPEVNQCKICLLCRKIKRNRFRNPLNESLRSWCFITCFNSQKLFIMTSPAVYKATRADCEHCGGGDSVSFTFVSVLWHIVSA